jgi:hypothetical protein
MFSHFQVNRLIWEKMNITAPESSDFRTYSFQKVTHFTEGSNVVNALASDR